MYPVCCDLRMASAEKNQCTAGPQEGISHGQRQAVKTDIHHRHIIAKDPGECSSQPPTLPLICKASQPAGHSKSQFPLDNWEVQVASSLH